MVLVNCLGVVGFRLVLQMVIMMLFSMGESCMSNVDHGLIALIAFASSFFGAFGKELADSLIKHVRGLRRRKI